MSNLHSISTYCNQCKGKCWDPTSQKKTQENATKMFGIIPNYCVNSENNIVKCPYALGLLK